MFFGAMMGWTYCVNLHATGSMLRAQSFPNTFDDLSFVDRMAVLAAGYSPWETTYDANGNCVSGCAYRGITIQDELDAIAQNTKIAVQKLNGEYRRTDDTITTPMATSDESVTAPVPDVQLAAAGKHAACAAHSATISATNVVPIAAPLDGDLVITSDFGPRKIAAGSVNHRGLDFYAARGTNVYAPASGTVTAAWNDTQYGGGLSIKIQHSDGYETSYCHLDKILVKTGDKIMAGCIIAKSGNTGTSTGPHLHYSIKHNDNPIDPLWTHNFLGRTYTFKSDARSSLHQGRKLPGEI